MKDYRNKILIGIGLVMLMAACKKQETFPVQFVGAQYVFDPLDSAGTNAHAFLLSVYSVLKSGHNRVNGDYLDAASDDAVSSAAGGANQVTILSTGSYSSINFPTGEDLWTITVTNGINTGNAEATNSYWSGIREANIFINGIGVVPVKGSLPDGLGERWVWQSEARFLRAFFYFELVKRYGGVPLLGNNVYTIANNLNLQRNTFSDCINYIVNECNAIQDSLITVKNYSPGSDNYRVTQGAALALKARVLLYAASPLFNDPDNSNTNPYIGYTSYSATRWVTAAAASQAVITLGDYSLDTNYRNVFLTENDPEVLFIRTNDATGNNIETNNAPIGFPSATGSGITSPTQDLVNAFPMANGLAITNPASGYNSQNPYVNRDPRLLDNVLYNGATWLTTPLQTFNGGQSRPLNGLTETLTGYYMDKFMNPLDTSTNKFVGHDEDWVIFRYAEILLDYAEAQNEAAGASSAVYAPLFALRKRAGIAIGAGNYGLTVTANKDTLRAIIQNERRIEMPFEEQRYFDIRRWKIAATVMNQPRMGVSITNSNGILNYNYVPVLTTSFTAPKMYLYPIPYAQIVEDPNLKQNPGW